MIFIATNKSWIGKIFTSQPDVLILVKKIVCHLFTFFTLDTNDLVVVFIWGGNSYRLWLFINLQIVRLGLGMGL